MNKQLLSEVPEVLKVTIYGKEQCSLCDKAKEIVHKVSGDFPLEIEEIDITTSLILWEKFKEDIPVVALNERIAFKGKITELWLRRVLGGGP